MKKVLFVATGLSLTFNVILLYSSVFNAKWTLPRVAGGQFETLPVGVRSMNAIVGSFSLYLIYFAFNLLVKNGAWNAKTLTVARAVSVVFVLSTFVNAISRSPLERWNSIPAAIIAIGIFNLSKSSPESPKKG